MLSLNYDIYDKYSFEKVHVVPVELKCIHKTHQWEENLKKDFNLPLVCKE